MALVTNFANFFGKFIGGAGAETVLECPVDKRYMILGLDIANLATTGVQVNVIIYNADESRQYYLVKNAPIPVGSSLQIISKQKHVLEEGDVLKIDCNVSTPPDETLNIVGSYMDVYTE